MTAGPLRRVLAAIEGGAGSLAEVERATGLGRDVVAASVDHLVRLGRLESRRLSSGCPAGGCAACPAGPGAAGPGSAGSAGAEGPAGSAGCDPAHGGPGLIVLTVRRRPTP